MFSRGAKQELLERYLREWGITLHTCVSAMVMYILYYPWEDIRYGQTNIFERCNSDYYDHKIEYRLKPEFMNI